MGSIDPNITAGSTAIVIEQVHVVDIINVDGYPEFLILDDGREIPVDRIVTAYECQEW
jgi:hypothetical protein